MATSTTSLTPREKAAVLSDCFCRPSGCGTRCCGDNAAKQQVRPMGLETVSVAGCPSPVSLLGGVMTPESDGYVHFNDLAGEQGPPDKPAEEVVAIIGQYHDYIAMNDHEVVFDPTPEDCDRVLRESRVPDDFFNTGELDENV